MSLLFYPQNYDSMSYPVQFRVGKASIVLGAVFFKEYVKKNII